MSWLRNNFPFLVFVVACAGGLYLFGMLTARYHWPPYPQVNAAIAEVKTALLYRQERLDWQYFRYDAAPETRDVLHDPGARQPGATLVSGFTDDEAVHSVRIVDADGATIQEWALSWPELWPDTPAHIPEPIMKRDQKHLHGTALMDNGDIVFNFTELATFRVNACGDVVWRLDRRGHHSVDVGPDGTLWVPGLVTHYEPVAHFPNHAPPFEEFWVLHLSGDGDVLDEFSLNKLLADNGYEGLLYGSTLEEFTPIVSRDTLHVNDIEVFGTEMEAGVAEPGDILVSLRNINTIILVDPDERRLKFISTGRVMRQHDVDFLDGNTISVFNNNNLLPEWLENSSGQRGLQGQKSRVETISLETGEILSAVDEAAGEAFFTDLMGAHQWLENGNLFVVESRAGRVFERAPDGRVVWEYYNIADNDLLGAVTYAERLDPSFDADFFDAARAACSG